MIEVQPPKRLQGHLNSLPSVFLGGSIEMDTAERWQDKLKKNLSDLNFVAYNPRRDDWDVSITQRASDSKFAEQVNWEIDHLLNADIVAFYLDPKTKSPITLLEIGYLAGLSNRANPQQQIVVCCPDGFWRKGNVEIICSRSNVTFVDTYDTMIGVLRVWILNGDHAKLPPC